MLDEVRSCCLVRVDSVVIGLTALAQACDEDIFHESALLKCLVTKVTSGSRPCSQLS